MSEYWNIKVLYIRALKYLNDNGRFAIEVSCSLPIYSTYFIRDQQLIIHKIPTEREANEITDALLLKYYNYGIRP